MLIADNQVDVISNSMTDLFPSGMSLPCLSFTEAEITSHDPNLTSTSVKTCGVHWNFGLHSHSSLFPLTALVFSDS